MKDKFQFFTEIGIVRWTGFIADSPSSLLEGLQDVPGSSIFYHLHHALFHRQRLTLHYAMNDFARWVHNTLGRKALAEKLASVDPLQFDSIRDAREKLIRYVESYIGEIRVFPRVPKEQEFYFMELRSFVIPTNIEAENLNDFINGLRRLGRGAMLYHFIEAHFRQKGKYRNDFSEWLSAYGAKEVAQRLDKLNPYLYDLETLRDMIISILKEYREKS